MRPLFAGLALVGSIAGLMYLSVNSISGKIDNEAKNLSSFIKPLGDNHPELKVTNWIGLQELAVAVTYNKLPVDQPVCFLPTWYIEDTGTVGHPRLLCGVASKTGSITFKVKAPDSVKYQVSALKLGATLQVAGESIQKDLVTFY